MVFVTGDTHANFRRFNTKSFKEQANMTRDDYVIVLGDFGGVWNGGKEEKYWLDWLNDKPFTTLFVDGNHENYDMLYALPEKNFAGGKVHIVRDNILHLQRGNIFKLCGRKFFAFGGASSHDIEDGILDPADFKTTEAFVDKIREYQFGMKQFRINHISWWEQELPNVGEMDFGLANLRKCKGRVDFVISHCLPQTVASFLSNGAYKPDDITLYFDDVADRLNQYGHAFQWYCGHYHTETRLLSKYNVLYHSIQRIV